MNIIYKTKSHFFLKRGKGGGGTASVLDPPLTSKKYLNSLPFNCIAFYLDCMYADCAKFFD